MRSKKGQIWIETAIYTLIGLAIIGIVLSIATPAIDKYKDEILIEQTIDGLDSLNQKIVEVKYMGGGNQRIANVRIKKGNLVIDSENNQIIYTLEDSKLEYSEPGLCIEQGAILIMTEKKGTKYDINLILNSTNTNIFYNGKENKRVLTQSSVPYKISVKNNGTEEITVGSEILERAIIDIREIS